VTECSAVVSSGGWSGFTRRPTSTYFRVPARYTSRDLVSTSWPLSRPANIHPSVAHTQPAKLPTSPSLCGPLQFRGSSAPASPLVRHYAAGSFFEADQRGPYPHSRWSVARRHHALSPTVEGLSGPLVTPTPHGSPYAAERCFDWDRQHLVMSGPRQCPDTGSVESGGMHWSTMSATGQQTARLRSTATSQRYPSTIHWQHFGGNHPQHETF